MPAFSPARAPPLLTVWLHRGVRRSSTTRPTEIGRIRRFGVGLIPDHLRRRPARPVSYYALFKWWLLLSQHPGCHRRTTSSRTEPHLGTLADGLGCFRLDRGHYRSRSHSRGTPIGIRSLVEVRRRVAPHPLSVALPPMGNGPRLPLKAFRREPDISPFD